MRRLWEWVKSHKLVVVLALVVWWLVMQRGYGVMPLMQNYGAAVREDYAMGSISLPDSGGGQLPPSTAQERMVITDTTMSVVVKDVAVAMDIIKRKTTELGGFMLDSHMSKPEENASGTISVRVPSRRLDEALAAFRAAGLRVIDERVMGQDVTDQYEDIDAKLAVLRGNKARMEEIMARATNVTEILNVQQQVFNLQSQIDQLVGRQKYLAGAADLSKVTLYLSTDEYSLPYAPSEPWRPDVVFKLAVRSLVAHLREIGSIVIWLVVYSVVWAPIAGVVWWFGFRKK